MSIIAITVLASACAGSTTYAPPPIIETLGEEDTTYRRVSTSTAAPVTNEHTPWWRTVGGRELDGLVDDLLSQSLDLQAARARIDQSRATARRARGDRLPQINGSLSAAQDRSINVQGGGFNAGQNRNANAQGDFDWNEVYSIGLEASWDADIFGRRRAAARSARLSAEAAELNAHALSQALIAELAQAYVEAWGFTEQTRIAAALAKSFEETIAITDARYRAGSRTATALDVQIARQNAAAAAAAVPELEALTRTRLDAIEVLLGRRPGALSLRFDVEAALQRPLVDTPGVPSDLLRLRPDVAAAELAYRAALQDAGAAAAARWPSLTLTASATQQTNDSSELFEVDQIFANFAAGLLAPIFQGGRLKADLQRAQARADELAQTYGATALSAVADVERALALCDAYAAEILLRQTSRDAAALSDRIAEDRYASGQASLLTVLETRRALNSAERDLLSAQQDFLASQINLALAAGGAWGALDADDDNKEPAP